MVRVLAGGEGEERGGREKGERGKGVGDEEEMRLLTSRVLCMA